MIYRIGVKKSVGRDLKRIDREQADRILRKIEEELPAKADQCLALTGKFAGLRKFRVGDYRVIFSIFEDAAIVLRIAHRRDVYK